MIPAGMPWRMRQAARLGGGNAENTKKTSGEVILRLPRSKNPDIPPLRRPVPAGHVWPSGRFPPLQMSCSCRDGADVSPDGLRDPGVNRGFLSFANQFAGKRRFMQIYSDFS